MNRRHLVLGAYTAVVLAIFSGAVRKVAELGDTDATASHHVLIPFVTFALVLQQRRAIFSAAQSAVAAGLPIALGGAALAWFGQAGAAAGTRDALSLSVAGAVVMWLGGFIALYGWKAFRAGLFPLLFLGFTIPFPSAVIESATLFLKTGSAAAVDGLFTLTGTTYHRDSFVFSLPTVVIEIADECSGIRSSLGLLLTSLLAGHMFLTTGWKKAVLVLFVLPLAILKNGIRIVSLTLMAVHVDPGFLTGRLHHEGGMVFFLLALAMFAPFFLFLQRSEAHASAATIQAEGSRFAKT
jgi:exosortase